ncbi:MAG: hypothetical protein ABIK15_10695 [Pseudomonadota bacterium]
MKKVKIKKSQILSKFVSDEQVYSTFDALEILDLKRGRLIQWMKNGFIPEGEQVVWGSKTKTVFKRKELYSIGMFKELLDLGLNRDVASRCIKAVNWDQVVSGEQVLFFFIDDGNNEKIYFFGHNDSIDFKVPQKGFFINLQKTKNAVDESI